MWLRPGPGRSAASATQSEGRKDGGDQRLASIDSLSCFLEKEGIEEFFFFWKKRDLSEPCN